MGRCPNYSHCSWVVGLPGLQGWGCPCVRATGPAGAWGRQWGFSAWEAASQRPRADVHPCAVNKQQGAIFLEK